jgi:hypothetical protein
MGGAAVNMAFLQHFELIAEGQFTVRRLERVYGSRFVKAEYDRLRTDALGLAPDPASS